jgi:2-keto-3-deoxy-L-rhamnonate aldolase RhmA
MTPATISTSSQTSRAYELKARIRRGETVLGIMAGDLAGAPLAHIAAALGLDFAVFDAEHSAFSEERLAFLAELCVLRGVAPVIRIQPSEANVQKAIHLGAVGVMLPGVRDLADAQNLVSAAYLPPLGSRGFSRHSAPSRLSAPDLRQADYSRSAAVTSQNTWVTVILQVETAELLSRLAEATAIPGVDVVLLGATDLSVSLGIPDAPATDERIVTSLDFAAGPLPAKGAVASTAALARQWQERGVTFFLLGHDIEFFEQGLRGALARLSQP